MYMDKKIKKICLPIMRYQFPQSLDENDGQEDILSNFISVRQFDRAVSICFFYHQCKQFN